MAALAALVFLAWHQPAFAYVDPGSASIVITAILGAIAAVGYSIRVFWAKIKALFSRKSKDRN